MPNLTLSLDEDLLLQAKACAQREHISLNRLVRDLIATHVQSPDGAAVSLADWCALADQAHVDPLPPTADGGRGWTRDELYRA